MSLIGSLEDLGLGDILQIIHLSQKSGVLSIRGDAGEGRIVFQDGLVRLACLKGDPDDLRGLLVDRGFVTEADFDLAARAARESGGGLVSALANHASIQTERIESLRRECAESAVGEMFSWMTGEFSFDVGAEDEFINGEMSLSTGVNAQYLAMESLRVRDEGSLGREQADLAAGSGATDEESSTLNLDLSAQEMFGVVDETGSDEERVSDAMLEVSHENAVRADFISVDAPEDAFAELQAVAELEAVPIPESQPVAKAPPVAASPSAAESGENLPPVVVIDPRLSVLEWVRSALADRFSSVHVFQRSQEGLGRIRQYLARAQAPILLVAPGIEGNPLSGIADAADFVQRLRDQAPRMPILWLVEEDCENAEHVPLPLPTVIRPTEQALAAGEPARELAERVSASLLEQRALLLTPATSSHAAVADAPRSALSGASAEELERLKEATQALSEASTRGDILPLVIRVAGESFARVAMFMVRGDQVIGMAQRGIEALGGPDDVEMRALQFERGESSWFSQVIETCRPLRAPVRNAGDQRFCDLIGGPARSHAYVAPILSSEHVVALLYADNGSSAVGPADTSALEVVLHHAGLALDRAALERALAEADT